MKNIFLTGMMGSGKSSVGKEIAKKLVRDFFDTDTNIEKNENKTISQIFNIYGEKYFRDLEKTEIIKLSQRENSVISLGGGAFCNNENIQIINKNGISIYLKTSATEILNRLNKEEISKRPLLKNIENFSELMKKREFFYSKSYLIILTDGKNIEEIAHEVLNKLDVL